ncbi:MAG: hypothetical protein JNL28_01385 [Planctomycetes bacterium]|nr:hypothetical protein [Planctomycetota bacterium]
MSARFITSLTLGTVLTVGALASGEALLRRHDWRYYRGAPHRVMWSLQRDREMARADDPYQFHAHQLWAPRPGARLVWTESERFNADGYRGPLLPVERPPRTLRLVALGGAAALGVGVANEDTFAALTARFVSARSIPCESMNLGVENFSLRQSLERYRDLARPYRPHIVVAAVSARTSYSPAPGGITDDELIEATRPLDRVHLAHPPSVKDGLRLVQGFHWLRDALGGPYWEDRDFQFHLRRLEPSSRSLDWPGIRRVPMNDFYGSLSLLLQETRQDGAHLVLLVLPTPATERVPPIQRAYDRAALDFGEREQLLVLDERNPHILGLNTDLVSTDVYGADRYPTACGHEAIATALSEIIVRGISAKNAQLENRRESAPKDR